MSKMANEKRLDLIERNALKRFVCEFCNSINSDEPCEPADCRCMSIIDQMPTVDAVEVVHGRWETANDGTHFCPHCGCDAPYTWDDIDRNFINSADDVPDRPSNYCPNCGAKMDGDGNG